MQKLKRISHLEFPPMKICNNDLIISAVIGVEHFSNGCLLEIFTDYPRPQGAAGGRKLSQEAAMGKTAVKCTNVNVRHTY